MLERLRSLLGEADEPRRITESGWEREDFGTERFNPVHVVDNRWVRAVAQLFGWDAAGRMRRRVAVDAQGRILVSLGGSPGQIPNVYQADVSTTATLVVRESPNRYLLRVRNISSVDVYVSNTDAVSPGTGFLVRPGETIDFSAWTFPMWMISVTQPGRVAVIEW